MSLHQSCRHCCPANPVPGLSPPLLSERHHGMIARARTLLRCRGEIRWQSMLRSYNSESEIVRMYDPGDDGPATRRESSICPDRYDIYISALSSPPPHSERTLVVAEARENTGSQFVGTMGVDRWSGAPCHSPKRTSLASQELSLKHSVLQDVVNL